MLSKVLAVVLAASVLSVGGYAYWQYTNDKPEATCDACPNSALGTEPVSISPCCLEPSRAACVSVEMPCCSDKGESVAEVLSIAPREVK